VVVCVYIREKVYVKYVCFVKCVEGKVSSGYDDLVVLADGQEANWEVVERILFIYAKLNPGHSYVQVCSSSYTPD